MAYEHKDGGGSLFKNDKGDNAARPDYRGELMVGGTLYELAAWIKEGQKGKYMSLSAKPKETSTKTTPSKSRGQVDKGGIADMQDDVPF